MRSPREPAEERDSPFKAKTRIRSARREEQIALQTDKMRLLAFLEEGLTEDDILGETGWSLERLRDIQNEVLAGEEQRLTRMRPEEIYTRFVLQSEGNLRVLDQLVQENMHGAQIGSVVGAVQAKQKILSGVIEMGQKLGIVHREPDKSLSIVANLDNEGLKEFLAKKINGLRSLYGEDRHFLDESEAAHAEILEAPAARPEASPVAPNRVVISRDKPAQGVVRRKAILPASLRGKGE